MNLDNICTLICVSAFAAVSLNNIIIKLIGEKMTTKAKTIMAVCIDFVIGALIGFIAADGTIWTKISTIAATAIGSVILADLGYDTIIKLFKAFIEKLLLTKITKEA